MIQSEKIGESPRMKEKVEMPAVRSPENGLSHILTLVLQELSLFYKRDVNGVGVLYDLLRSPWLQALLKVVELLREAPQSTQIRELRRLLRAPHFKGATIKRHEITGDIMVARVISGGLADRSGLLYAGDKLVEVNGVPVEGLEPEQVIHILALSQGTIMFKLIPVSDRPVSNQTTLYVRAMAEYWPLQDPAIPCADAGLPFKKGDILQIVDQNDAIWWQARKVSDLSACAGLIPSNHLLKSLLVSLLRMQFNVSIFWTSPAGFRRSMRLCRRKSHNSQPPCYARCPSSCYSTVAAPYEEVVRYQRHPGDRNRLIVLVGPSGVGVNEIRRQLIGINPHHFQSAVPHTTRAQKSYEENGREYHYVSKETFENMVYSHRMLEYGEYKGHLYGTSVDAVRTVLDEGKICVVDLEPQSIQVARTHELKPYIIFIKPSSMSCMKQSRKNARMITNYYVNMKFKEEDLQEMEDSAKKMEAQFGQFFDQVIVNDNLQEACMQLLTAVRRAQDEPQWVPATWICSDTQP
uniref:MAGUK p55 scaffold protein 4 n=1 Tax=Sphenodon punctatus TaxID=8508 RepID=A0A8D0G8L3_SPHPU